MSEYEYTAIIFLFQGKTNFLRRNYIHLYINYCKINNENLHQRLSQCVLYRFLKMFKNYYRFCCEYKQIDRLNLFMLGKSVN